MSVRSCATRPWPAAGLARALDDLPLAAALGAGPGDREEPLLVAQLTAPLAGRALGPPRSRLGATPVAGLAGLEPRDLEPGLEALCRLLERDLEVVAKVVARPRAAAAPPAPAAEEALEEIAEEVLDPAEVDAARRQVDPAVAVVLSPAVGVRQDRVRLVDHLEALLGLRVAGLRSGWCLSASCRNAFLISASLASRGDAEEVVVVALGHGLRGVARRRPGRPAGHRSGRVLVARRGGAGGPPPRPARAGARGRGRGSRGAPP